MMMNDPRQYAPATLRNRDFILGILRDVLPTKGVILEVASGSGEHVVYFARNLPSLVFQPSDREPEALQSVAAWVKATRVTNVRAPMVLDASQSRWPIASADGIICINMVHISPWDATLGLIRGAAAILPPTAPFYLYGPYKREGFRFGRRAFRTSHPEPVQAKGTPQISALTGHRPRTSEAHRRRVRRDRAEPPHGQSEPECPPG